MTDQQGRLPFASVEIDLLTFNTPEGVQGGMRHSRLQGIWWDRSLESWMFLETDFMISVISSYLEKH